MQVQTTSTSASITVTKPESTLFYAYVGNKQSHTDTGSFEDDFEILNSTNLSSKTNLTGMVPGDKMIFAIKTAKVTSSANLGIKQLISNDSTRQDFSQKRYVMINNGGTSTEINIGWAMDIYKLSNTTGENYTDFLDDPTLNGENADVFNYSYATNRSALETGFNASTKIKTFDDNSLLPILSYTGSANNLFIFFAVVFSDDADVCYREVALNNSVWESVTDIPNSGNRYFVKDDTATGKYNCYGGLSFALPELKLTIV